MDVTARLTRAEERVAAFDLKRVIESPLTTIGIAAALAISALMEIADRMSALALLAALLATAPQALRRSQPWLAVVLTLWGPSGCWRPG
ncbi:hypothetical protein ACFQX6_32880 [Streptosporangium lutulentum]